jgi:hypothetical protein
MDNQSNNYEQYTNQKRHFKGERTKRHGSLLRSWEHQNDEEWSYRKRGYVQQGTYDKTEKIDYKLDVF